MPPATAQARLPVAAKFFHTAPLDACAQHNLLHTAQVAGKQTLRNARSIDDHLVYAMHTDPTSQRRMKMVLGKDSQDPSLACMVGHTQFHGTIEEFAAYFRTESLGRDTLDTQKLYTLTSPSADDPLRYTGVHWTACKMPMGPSRDFCYLESHCEFVDRFGHTDRRGWMRTLHSIDVPACPPLQASHSLIRTRMFRSGHIFLEGQTKGLLDVYAVLTVQFDAPAQHQPLQMSFMRRWVTQIMSLPNVFLHRRLAAKPLLPEDAMRSKDSVKMCMICTARFNLFNSKHNCRVCGQVVCSNCHIQWKFEPNKVRICLKCSDGASSSNRHPSDGDRESLVSTWKSTASSASTRRPSGPSKTLSPAPSRSSFSSDTHSVDLTRSGCSEDTVLFDPNEFALPDLDKQTSQRQKSPQQQPQQYDLFVDLAIFKSQDATRKTKRRETPTKYASGEPNGDSTELHDLLQNMYDDKCPVVQGLYRDLLSQTK
ncbi:unnamed protein product [Aphanomyces euteiches]